MRALARTTDKGSDQIEQISALQVFATTSCYPSIPPWSETHAKMPFRQAITFTDRSTTLRGRKGPERGLIECGEPIAGPHHSTSIHSIIIINHPLSKSQILDVSLMILDVSLMILDVSLMFGGSIAADSGTTTGCLWWHRTLF